MECLFIACYPPKCHSIRHHAALLLKKKVGTHYGKFDANQQAELRTQLLQLLCHESNKGVAVAIAGIIASLTKVVFASDGAWAELFDMLLALGGDPNEFLRFVCYSLLEQVLS